mgnify:CR=1 FL=1
MLIVIEGLDGSGKSTQVKRLRNYLQTKSGNLEYIHFPRYDSPVYGELIGKFLRGGFGSIDAVHPQLVALLYAEDRHGAAPQMWDTLNKGGIVLLDRYVYSNIAYQCAKINDETRREELREWIFDTEFGQFGLPRPDLNIFLDVPIGFVEKKLENPRGGDDRNYLEGRSDIHEADIEFQKNVRKVYLRQCELDPGFIRVDCSDENGRMLPPDAISAAVQAVVEQIALYRKQVSQTLRRHPRIRVLRSGSPETDGPGRVNADCQGIPELPSSRIPACNGRPDSRNVRIGRNHTRNLSSHGSLQESDRMGHHDTPRRLHPAYPVALDIEP